LPVFRPDRFVQSEDVQQVLAQLSAEGKKAHVIAGGTGFYELARRGYIPEVKSVVSIMKLGLTYVKTENGIIRIGSTTTLQSLLESGQWDGPGLEVIGDALKEIRPIQVRNVATVGGEVCISVPLVDLPTALLTCGASLVILSGKGERETALDDFYIDAFLTRLGYGEIVKEVRVPAQPLGARSAFTKIGRTSYDFNLVNVGVSLTVAGDGRPSSVRTFVGGIGRAPIRATEFERRVTGRAVDGRSVMDAAEASFEEKDLLPSVHGSKEYKHAIIPIVMRDCFLKAYARTGAMSR
jgi:aerobic carbon-monoxide dehydrogenase medium subunit